MPKLVIYVEGDDHTDLDFLRIGAVARVEEYVEEMKGEGRLDGNVEVSWDYEDD